MRTILATFAGLVALVAVSAQAAPVPPAKATGAELGASPAMTLGAAAPASGPTTPGASACCGGSIRFEYEKVQPDLPGDRSMTVPRWPR
jgi:hypothetical protein